MMEQLKINKSNQFRCETKLNYVTNETISKIRFCKSYHILASSWDGLVTLIDAHKNEIRATYSHYSPVLDCCFLDRFHSFSGSLDSKIIGYDLIAGKKTLVGRHEDAVKCVEYSDDVNLLITGGWDSKIKIWDTRMKECIETVPQPDKVFALSICGDKIIAGTAGRKIYVWDLKNLRRVLQRRESTLSHQTRCIQSFSDKTGFIVSSIEGHASVGYLDPSPKIQENTYAFRCHTEKENGTRKVYPVNAIASHPTLRNFATGGSDGRVFIWDLEKRVRVGRSRKFLAPVTSVCYDHSGTTIAIASSIIDEWDYDSYTFPLNAIYISLLGK